MENLSLRPPQYQKNTNIKFSALRKTVFDKVKMLEKSKRFEIKLKAFLFPLLYFSVYALLLSYGNTPGVFYLSYFLLGIFLVLNFLNLVHDAVHEVIFTSAKWMNKIYVYFFDLLGANSYIWKIRHLQLHHAYPNIMNWDSDFEQSPMVRVFPHAEARKMHAYQHIYLPFMYPFYLFNWLVIRDFKDFFSDHAIVRKIVKIPKKEFVKLFLFKGFFFFYLLLLPKMVLGVRWGSILLGFCLMILTASLLSLLVLLSPHANIHSDFPQADESGQMPYNWFEHQLKCTNDVSNDNFFVRFFMGSFNYHIAHHLFPNVHHVYYPEITKSIKDFALANNLPYRQQTLWQSLKGHYDLLKQNAVHENIFEETM
ncbi:fatty acid desaturase [Zunongwangia sp. H14]|uniref:fatty acid desaturase family protein n=1 Tax=Zunongwangia sp. H14 TaxID=3240792 RepID=UPI0035649F4D